MGLQHLQLALLTGAALVLSACGGGGGVNSTPFVPEPPPPPPPPPPPGPPIPPGHLGLVSSAPFAVLGMGSTFSSGPDGENLTVLSGPSAQDIQFSYDPSNNSYLISLPGIQPGVLGNTGYGGTSGEPATSSFSHVLDPSSGVDQGATVFLPVPGTTFSPYTYTSYGSWSAATGVSESGDTLSTAGIFAYGIPTAAGDVPTVGSASYTADIIASLGPGTYPPNGVEGDVSLSFDFAGGTLSGSMHPEIIDGFDGIFVDFGEFKFTQTVYSTGSTSFSGKFIVPGLPNADSAFNGIFTGPQAAELMAQFRTPFLLNGEQGTMSGVWVGKKGP